MVRKEDGSLHFFVNGVAQGPAAWNVPPSVYAVVDLYGQAAQATIMDDMGERGSHRKRERENKHGHVADIATKQHKSLYTTIYWH